MVGIAIIIATPIAWWAMNKWLQAFTYRISISWWMFALAGFIAICIALITVSFQAIKAAVAKSDEEFEDGIEYESVEYGSMKVWDPILPHFHISILSSILSSILTDRQSP